MQICDAWTNVFAAPGTRTTGNRAGDFALVSVPDWRGTLPPDVQKIAAPTNLVWIIGTHVHGRQGRLRHGQRDSTPVRPGTARGLGAPLQAAGQGSGRARRRCPDAARRSGIEDERGDVFDRLARLMGSNPPSADDEPMISRLRQIGVAPGAPFRLRSPSGASQGRDRARHCRRPGPTRSDREGCLGGGARARLADRARPRALWNRLRDARARRNTRSRLEPRRRRRIPHHACRRRRREAHGCESLPAAFRGRRVASRPRFLVGHDVQHSAVPREESDRRHAVGDRNPLRFNADGSLDLYLQNADPGPDKRANWLPAPPDGFSLVMRLYSPKKAVLDGSWSPPPVIRA